jgi:hypothetical protein
MAEVMMGGDKVVFSEDGLTVSLAFAAAAVIRAVSYTETTAYNASVVTTLPAMRSVYVSHFTVLDPSGRRKTPWVRLASPRTLGPGMSLQFDPGALSCTISPKTSHLDRAELAAAQMMNAFDAEREMLQKKQAEWAEGHKHYLAGLSPAMQSFISQIENKHMTLEEFQKLHGIRPGDMRHTEQVVEDLRVRNQSIAELNALMKETFETHKSKNRAMSRCPAQATVHSHNGRSHTTQCDRPREHVGSHSGIVPLAVVRGRQGSISWESRKAYFRELPDGTLRPTTENAIYVPKPEENHFADAFDSALQQVPYAPPRKVECKRREAVTMTREEYRQRFSEMEYVVTRNLRFGFQVLVTLARGGRWYYWRPTRGWANAVGAKRLKRELALLDIMYERANPQGVKARDLGVHYQMTTDEITEELKRRDAEKTNAEMEQWDAAFKGEERAS